MDRFNTGEVGLQVQCLVADSWSCSNKNGAAEAAPPNRFLIADN